MPSTAKRVSAIPKGSVHDRNSISLAMQEVWFSLDQKSSGHLSQALASVKCPSEELVTVWHRLKCVNVNVMPRVRKGYWMWSLYIFFIDEKIVVFTRLNNIWNPDLCWIIYLISCTFDDSIIFSLSSWCEGAHVSFNTNCCWFVAENDQFCWKGDCPEVWHSPLTFHTVTQASPDSFWIYGWAL